MKRCISLFTTTALAFAMFSTAGFAAEPPSPAPAYKPLPPEPHPAIRAAIEALEKAKYDLQHAAHDFGGHRAEALEAVDNAIKQLHAALEYDKK